MNTANYVDEQIKILKAQGIPLSQVAWQTALNCIGWPYVFGARGQYCTPSNRRARYNATPDGKDKDNIKNKCKNFNSTSYCNGCQWFPDNQMTRCYDCRGFTYWVLLTVYGWSLNGAGCTSQWNDNNNWKAKGKISEGFPENTLVCLFYSQNGQEKVWEHTGFGFNDETVECSGTVYHKAKRDKKWTHWAIPKCVEGDVPPVPGKKPTIKRGSTGAYVVECQEDLIKLGYALSPYGADGKFGKKTEDAVKAFQKTHTDANGKQLKVDGIVGDSTWWALDNAIEPTPTTKLYTVHIPHQNEKQCENLKVLYPDSWKTEE